MILVFSAARANFLVRKCP